MTEEEILEEAKYRAGTTCSRGTDAFLIMFAEHYQRLNSQSTQSPQRTPEMNEDKIIAEAVRLAKDERHQYEPQTLQSVARHALGGPHDAD